MCIRDRWNLDWRTGADRHGEPVHSAMYRDLWINGPKECMEYPDYPFDAHFGRAVSSYLPREAMRDYIVGRVAEVAGRIRPQIRFATAVRWVQPLDDGGFGVTSEDLVTREATTTRSNRSVTASRVTRSSEVTPCLLYTSDAADDCCRV